MKIFRVVLIPIVMLSEISCGGKAPPTETVSQVRSSTGNPYKAISFIYRSVESGTERLDAVVVLSPDPSFLIAIRSWLIKSDSLSETQDVEAWLQEEKQIKAKYTGKEWLTLRFPYINRKTASLYKSSESPIPIVYFSHVLPAGVRTNFESPFTCDVDFKQIPLRAGEPFSFSLTYFMPKHLDISFSADVKTSIIRVLDWTGIQLSD